MRHAILLATILLASTAHAVPLTIVSDRSEANYEVLYNLPGSPTAPLVPASWRFTVHRRDAITGQSSVLAEAEIPGIQPSDSPQRWEITADNAAQFGFDWAAAEHSMAAPAPPCTKCLEYSEWHHHFWSTPGPHQTSWSHHLFYNFPTGGLVDTGHSGGAGNVVPYLHILESFTLEKIVLDLRYWRHFDNTESWRERVTVIGDGSIVPIQFVVPEPATWLLLIVAATLISNRTLRRR